MNIIESLRKMSVELLKCGNISCSKCKQRKGDCIRSIRNCIGVIAMSMHTHLEEHSKKKCSCSSSNKDGRELYV